MSIDVIVLVVVGVGLWFSCAALVAMYFNNTDGGPESVALRCLILLFAPLVLVVLSIWGLGKAVLSEIWSATK
jgi:hypothetical protein